MEEGEGKVGGRGGKRERERREEETGRSRVHTEHFVGEGNSCHLPPRRKW